MATNSNLGSLVDEIQQLNPNEDMSLLREYIKDFEDDVGDKTGACAEAKDQAAGCLSKMVNYFKDSTLQKRMQLPLDSLSHLRGIIGNYYVALKWQDLSPRVFIIGETGVGKSSLGNILLEGKGEEERFEVGSSAECVTQEIKEIEGNWLGQRKRKRVTIIDTPGTGDPSITDEKRMAEFIANLRNTDYMTAFVMVFNSAVYRFNQSHMRMIQAFQSVYGVDMFNNLIVIFTHWTLEPKEVRKRERKNISKEQRKEEFQKKFSENFQVYQDIPFFFFDCDDYKYNKNREIVEEHEKTLEAIMDKIESFSPYKTIDLKKLVKKQQDVMNLLKQVLKNVQDKKKTVQEEDKRREAEQLENRLANNLRRMEVGDGSDEVIRAQRPSRDTCDDTFFRGTRNDVLRDAQRSIRTQNNLRQTRGLAHDIESHLEENFLWYMGGAALLGLLAIFKR